LRVGGGAWEVGRIKERGAFKELETLSEQRRGCRKGMGISKLTLHRRRNNYTRSKKKKEGKKGEKGKCEGS